PDNGRLEVELQIDSNHVGQLWTVRITPRRRPSSPWCCLRRRCPSGALSGRWGHRRWTVPALSSWRVLLLMASGAASRSGGERCNAIEKVANTHQRKDLT